MTTKELVKTQPALPIHDNPTPGQLLQLALAKESGIDVIERITALMERERHYQSGIDFDESLRQCQKRIERVAPDKSREKGMTWASYTALDTAIRPIYAEHGFAISFSQEPAAQGRMGVVAHLTRHGIDRTYHREVPIVQPGGTSLADAEEAAFSRAQRYLVLRIFNISVGVDEAEMKPYETKPEDLLEESVVLQFIAGIEGSNSVEQLKANYLAAAKAAAKDPRALAAFEKAKKDVWQKRGFKS